MDRWDWSSDYEGFMGRWSRLVAAQFVRAIDGRRGLRWLDVGCGTGALLHTIRDLASPMQLAGVDPSPEFADAARARLRGQADVRVAGGEDLPFVDDAFDLVVSGLVLNFIPDPLAAVREWKRVARPGGVVSAYVWDYSDGMEFLRYFWDAVVELDPAAAGFDEGVRFPTCQPDRLQDLFDDAGLSAVESGSVWINTVFRDFDDYWAPFLSGQGPAPGYVAELGDSQRSRLADRLRSSLGGTSNGAIELRARAWTVAGRA